MTESEQINLKFRKGCEAILEGYKRTLRRGGHPVVLAEDETDLERFGLQSLKAPPDFWEKLRRHPSVPKAQFPQDAKAAIESTLPGRGMRYQVVRRQAGLGSLGQPRFVAIAQWQGGCIAREGKAYLPSASIWLTNRTGTRVDYYQRLMARATRSPDPYQKVVRNWIVRRLSSDSNPIEISDLPSKRDDEVLLYAMAQEVANVHLATPGAKERILRDVRSRRNNWLRAAAKDMAKTVERDWEEYAGS